MEKSLVCITAYSNKFWKIKAQGTIFIVSYGKIGTGGSVNTKEFSSEEHCLKEANRLIESKLKKGYQEVEKQEEELQGSGMTEGQFWGLLDMAHYKRDGLEQQMEWLVGKLARKSVEDIIRFSTHFNQQYAKSYTSDLWAAAFIIMGSCSNDSFDYFRAWLLYLGKEAYVEAIRNPESLIPYLDELEEDVPEFEDLLYAASLAFEEKTGSDQDTYLDLYWEMSGDDDDQPDWEEGKETLRQKFPLLWKLYGEAPLG
ncbi:DUF4240 domain-containing protein [Planococcus sp. SE5232]|uniref:DUF4240 domain-containing protein n=1 Tax=unclassified Planococcus (in: firmicutes) TaxID=2662419 RepID=UPI001CC06FC3|nr:DUF4240 domain-containing protein [Planococcus sp. 4-30]